MSQGTEFECQDQRLQSLCDLQGSIDLVGILLSTCDSDNVTEECLFLPQTEICLSVRKCIPLFQSKKKIFNVVLKICCIIKAKL